MNENEITETIAELGNQDTYIKFKAAMRLHRTHIPGMEPHLLPLMEDPDEDVRWIATLTARYYSGDHRVLACLVDAIEDPDPYVQAAAIASLKPWTKRRDTRNKYGG